MLQAYIGTFDQFGLRSLRVEEEPGTCSTARDAATQFWATLDTDELPLIRDAFNAGHRSAALRLILERAHCCGRVE